MRTAVIFPTRTESRYFDRRGIDVYIGGVGLTATACSTMRIIRDHRPDLLILGGIAGVYPHSSLRIGDAVLVSAECEADLGFFHDDGFRHISEMHLDMEFPVQRFLECPHLPAGAPLRAVRSNSLNAAIAPFVRTDRAEIENMEGYAFFRACLQEGVRFLEVRSVSNVVNTDHAGWDYDASIRSLTTALNRVIDHLEHADND